jgi:hypothetical protein
MVVASRVDLQRAGRPATTPTGISCWIYVRTDTLIADTVGVYHPPDFNDGWCCRSSPRATFAAGRK